MQKGNTNTVLIVIVIIIILVGGYWLANRNNVESPTPDNDALEINIGGSAGDRSGEGADY